MTLLYILIAILIFGALIFIHELGHFLAARAFGVAVKEFAIGMGPRIFSWRSKKYGTEYGLRLLPIGGFVSMVGEDDDSDSEKAFCNKNVWQRMAIILAGPVMNVLLGFLLMVVLVVGQGRLIGTTVADFHENATSSAQLESGDEIIKVGRVRVHTFNDVIYEIMHQGTEPIDVTVIRDGERIVLSDVEFPVVVDSGVEIGKYDIIPYLDEPTVANYVKHAFSRSVSTVKMVIDSIVDLVSGRYGMEAVSGPVGVTEVIVDAARDGIFTLLYFVIVISINLGIFNLIPFPALDGGRILIYIIEIVRGKPVKKEVEGYINFAGLIILFAFMAFVVVKDVVKIFGGI